MSRSYLHGAGCKVFKFKPKQLDATIEVTHDHSSTNKLLDNPEVSHLQPWQGVGVKRARTTVSIPQSVQSRKRI